MSPVIFKNYFTVLAKPVDGGKLFAGKEIFGDHKTWRGLIVATVVGGVIFLVQRQLILAFPSMVAWSPFDLRLAPWWFGFIFAAGAIGGDLVKSFFKRRFAIPAGSSWYPFDQIDFLLGGAFVASFYYTITPLMWLIILFFGSIAHIVVNHIGFWLRIKDSPW